jgi:V/A-type H+-transporting ATPase subunit A
VSAEHATQARIRWISGPVLRARTQDAFHVHEAIAVGPDGLLGEVIQLADDEIVAQVYEDTTGLRPGDRVAGTGRPLSVRLGPSLVGGIFDGLLRPLERSAGDFVKPGMLSTGDADLEVEVRVATGDAVVAGAVFARAVVDGDRERPGSACLVPPDVEGTVTWTHAGGTVKSSERLVRIETAAGEVELAASHPWPVRHVRPVRRRLAYAAPMVTGQRILDTLFPVVRGGRAALPGGFGTGKTVLQESLAKWCDADIIVYVGCGERGNEMAEVLDELPKLNDPRTHRPLMERTVIIANTSNMPVAAREASIYTAMTVAEFFRDQGLHVALMADSTSRWAEALREVSGRLGELPAESGYPAYLASRLADFYERAARVETLSGDEGSVTVIGAVSPPAGDFSEPVTSHTKRYVRSFWTLDRERAQARFYPAIHPLQSYAEDIDVMGQWWETQGNPDWTTHRRRILGLLEQQSRLERMARIVGKESLPAEQQLVLLNAQLVNEGFLRQSSFSEIDRYCSPRRQTAMLRLLMRFVDLAEEAVSQGTTPEALQALPVFRTLQRLGEELSEERVDQVSELYAELDRGFASLQREATA